MRKLLLAILALGMFAQTAIAENKTGCASVEEPNSPLKILKEKWNTIAPVLADDDIKQDQKKDRVDKIACDMFNFPLMAKLAIGKKQWKQMTGPQCDKFTKLFIEKLKDAYWAKISLYTGQEVIFKQAVQKKRSVHIPMVLVTEDKDIVILYKFHQPDKKVDDWKIYDVEIQGVSIILTYRSQFEDALKNGTIQELLTKLEKPEKD